MGPNLTKITLNKKAVENKLYHDVNGDVYIGRNGRLIFYSTNSNNKSNNSNNNKETTIITNTITLKHSYFPSGW